MVDTDTATLCSLSHSRTVLHPLTNLLQTADYLNTFFIYFVANNYKDIKSKPVCVFYISLFIWYILLPMQKVLIWLIKLVYVSFCVYSYCGLNFLSFPTQAIQYLFILRELFLCIVYCDFYSYAKCIPRSMLSILCLDMSWRESLAKPRPLVRRRGVKILLKHKRWRNLSDTEEWSRLMVTKSCHKNLIISISIDLIFLFQ